MKALEKEIFTDMQFHGIDSDGQEKITEIIEKVKNLREEFNFFVAILTEHNIDSRIPWSPAGMEVNTYDSDLKKFAHMLFYGKEYPADLLEEAQKIRTQQWQENSETCRIISSDLWIDFNIEDVLEFSWQQIEKKNINRYHIFRYLIKQNVNIDSLRGYICEHSYSEKPLWIHPKKLVEITKNHGFISLSHPHVTFATIWAQWFRENWVAYIEKYWIQMIEVPTTASQEWIEAIEYVASQAGIFKSYGSDNHGKWADETHGEFWALNPHVIETEVCDSIYKYSEQIGLILPARLSHQLYIWKSS